MQTISSNGQTFYVNYKGELYVCEYERTKSTSEEIDCYRVNMIGEVIVTAPIFTPQVIIPPPVLPYDPGSSPYNPIVYRGEGFTMMAQLIPLLRIPLQMILHVRNLLTTQKFLLPLMLAIVLLVMIITLL